MNEQTDFLDSHAPIDFDPERAEAWPLPPVTPWQPKQQRTLREVFADLAERCGLA